MNETTKELLKLCPKALETCHNLKGYDFNKPFNIVKLDGAFTVNMCVKEMYNNDFIIMFKSYKYYNNSFIFVEVIDGKINLDFSIGGNGVTNVRTKTDFEKYRKNACVAFLISQDNKYRTPVNPDLNCSGTPINRKAVKPIDFSERCYNITNFECYQNGVKYSRPFRYVSKFDKSGYRVDEKQKTLHYKALELKNQKNKKALESYNMTKEIDALEKSINDLKALIISTFKNSGTASNELTKISDCMAKFRYICHDIEYFKGAYNEGIFRSVDFMLDSYNDIIRDIYILKLKLGGEK